MIMLCLKNQKRKIHQESIKNGCRKYPKEVLQYNDNTIKDIDTHYDYLVNHELIKN